LQTNEFIWLVKLSIVVISATFPNQKMKILYTLLFMNGGIAEVWASNETQAVINGTMLIITFNEFMKQVEDAFGDLDQTQTTRTKLHDLHMITGMSADKYTAQFEILSRHTGFNNKALKDHL